MKKLTLETAIQLLMSNDRNATWDECETVTELIEGLECTLEDYEETEETYTFYLDILNGLKAN